MNKMLLRRKRNNPARRRIERTSLDTKNRLSRRSLEQTKEGSSSVSEELVENAKQTEEEIEKIFSGVQDLEPLRKIVEGKRVIYVGPSPILKGRGLGEFIDSFDVVVRSNNMYKVPEELWEDYGKRCDVAYFVMSFLRNNKIDVEYLKREKTLVFSKNNSGIAKRVFTGKIDWVEFQPRFVDFEGRLCEEKVNRRMLSTGILSVVHVLACKPLEIHFTGVDFYTNNKTHVVYYTTKKKVDKAIEIHHDLEANKKFFRELLESRKELQADEFIKALL